MSGTIGMGRFDQNLIAEMTRRGLTAREIAGALGCTQRTVVRYRERAKVYVYAPAPPMSPDEVAWAQSMIEDGCNYYEIGRTLGRNWSTIAKRWPGHSWTPAQVVEYRSMVRRLESL